MNTVNEGLMAVARAMTLSTTRLEYRLANLARFTAVMAVRTGMTPEEACRAIEVAFANADAAAELDLRRLDGVQEGDPVGAPGSVVLEEA